MKNITRSFRLATLLWAVLAPTVPAVNGQTFLTNGLVAYYPFNGNADDESGNGNGGVVVGAILSTNRFGQPANSYRFKAPHQYVMTTNTLGFPVGTQDFSISLWFSLASYGAPAFLCNQSMGDFQFWLSGGVSFPSSQTISFQTGGGGASGSSSDYVFSPPLDWSLNQWYNIQAVRSGTTFAIYRDGVLVVESSNLVRGNQAPSGARNLSFGCRAQDSQLQLDGQLDDIRIYNRALSPDEVARLYEYEYQPCPHRATATAIVVNGFVVGATITHAGCGYTSPPAVIIKGTGTGAEATATVNDGMVTFVTVTDAGSGYSTNTTINIASPPFMPWLEIGVSKVRVAQHVVLGMQYVLESSADLGTWMQVGDQFTADVELIVQEFDVAATGRYFRIRQLP